MSWKITNCIMPPEDDEEARENRRRRKDAKQVSISIERTLASAHKNEVSCLKLLLLGTGESGKTTILKQMKIIHIDGYSDTEKIAHIPNIKQNLRDSIVAIVAAMDLLKIPFEHPGNATRSRNLINESLRENYEYPEEFFDDVRELWQDDGVQASFGRSNEYQLIDSAKYFLDKIDIIQQGSYVPTLQDILRCRKMTDAINEINFEIPDGRKTKVHFKVFDVGGQRGARKKWIQLFDKVTAILFLADCSSFDQTLREDRSKNRLLDALEVFEQTWLNKYLQSVPILVFINKIDALEEKVRSGRTIQSFFDSVNLTLRKMEGDRSLGSCLQGHKNSCVPDDATAMAGPHISRRNNRSLLRRISLRGSSPIAAAAPRQSKAQGPLSVAQLVANSPYKDYNPTADEKKDFLHSYPLDEVGKTMHSQRRARSKELPEVHPDTIQISCYIRHIFAEITKQRIVSADGVQRRRKCHFYYTCAVNTDNIQKLLDGCRAFLMEEHLERFGIL